MKEQSHHKKLREVKRFYYKNTWPPARTSATNANLVFVKTGKKLNAFAEKRGLTFTSFVDDSTFSATEDFKNDVQFIIETLQQGGFKISHKKANYKTKNPMVTGIIVRNKNLSLPRSYKIKLQASSQKTSAQIKRMTLYAERVQNA